MTDTANTTFDTLPGQTYCLTAAGGCAVTAHINGSTVTLVSVAGGQGTFIAPAAKVTMVGEGCLTRCFKAAAPSAQGGGGTPVPSAEPLLPVTGDTPALAMQHAVWQVLPATIRAASIAPAASAAHAYSMQLLVTPAANLAAGWLSSTSGECPLLWPYGEPMLAGGFRYCITVVQLPWCLLANMTPLGKA